MAYLKPCKSKNGKIHYYSRIDNLSHWSKSKLISLKTTNYKDAFERHLEVEKCEKAIKEGTPIEEFEWSWNNPQNRGRTGIVKKRLPDFINDWLDIKNVNIKQSSVTRYRVSMNSFLDVVGYTYPLKRIDTKTIEGYKKVYASQFTPSGMNINLRAIKCFLRWALEEEYISKMPKIKLMKVPKAMPKFINDLQWNHLMGLKNLDLQSREVYSDDFWKNLFHLYRATGLRRTELLLAQLDGNYLIVKPEHSKTDIEKEVQIQDYEINYYTELQKELALWTDKGRTIETFASKVSKVFKKACVKLDIDATLHSLRHTFAVRRYLQTRDLYQVCKELFHDSITMTEVYAVFSFRRLEQEFPTLVQKQSQAPNLETPKRETRRNKRVNSRLLN